MDRRGFRGLSLAFEMLLYGLGARYKHVARSRCPAEHENHGGAGRGTTYMRRHLNKIRDILLHLLSTFVRGNSQKGGVGAC